MDSRTREIVILDGMIAFPWRRSSISNYEFGPVNRSFAFNSRQTSSSSLAGSSIASFTLTRNCTASRPSMMR